VGACDLILYRNGALIVTGSCRIKITPHRPILEVERDWKPDTEHACSHFQGVVGDNQSRSVFIWTIHSGRDFPQEITPGAVFLSAERFSRNDLGALSRQ
jgi:hypothetical protein